MTQEVPWCTAGPEGRKFWHCQARSIMRNASTTYTFIKAIEGVQDMTCKYIGLIDPLNVRVFDFVNLHHDYWAILNAFSKHKGAFQLYHLFILGCHDYYTDIHQLNHSMCSHYVCVELHRFPILPNDMSLMYFDPVRKFYFRECTNTMQVQQVLDHKQVLGPDAHVSVREFSHKFDMEQFGTTYHEAVTMLAKEIPRPGHFFVYIKASL